MQKRKKQLLGLLGLAIVVAMTIFAYTMPAPGASAISESVPVRVQVVREGQATEIEFTSLKTDEVVVNRKISIGFKYAKATKLNLFIKNTGAITLTRANDSAAPEADEIEIPLAGTTCDYNGTKFTIGEDQAVDYNEGFADCVTEYTLTGDLAGQYGVGFALRAVASNRNTSGAGADAVSIIYRSAKFDGTVSSASNGDPVVKIEMSDDVKRGILVVTDKDGKPIFGSTETEKGEFDAIPFDGWTADNSGKVTVTIPFKEKGITTGDYQIALIAYSEDGNAEKIVALAYNSFNYNVNSGTTPGGNRPGGSYDPNDPSDPNNPDNPNYDPNDPNRPNVPNTGSNLLDGLNISQSDYIVTGLLAFGFVTAFAIFLIVRRNRR